MSKEHQLLESLINQAKALPLRDDPALYGLRKRTEMLARRIFGSSSPYLKSLEQIYFLPTSYPTPEEAKDERWLEGQRSFVNLICTMIEEWRLFESAPTPVLTINDQELQGRTHDLLSAPGSYDRVLREATTILEDRIRHKVPFEDLAKLIPNASEQRGENLVNKLLNPNNPVIVLGERPDQNRLFRMLGGVVAYLRNPSHHSMKDTVEWSWAWSVVGLVDQLLADLDSASYQRPANL